MKDKNSGKLYDLTINHRGVFRERERSWSSSKDIKKTSQETSLLSKSSLKRVTLCAGQEGEYLLSNTDQVLLASNCLAFRMTLENRRPYSDDIKNLAHWEELSLFSSGLAPNRIIWLVKRPWASKEVNLIAVWSFFTGKKKFWMSHFICSAN